MNRQVRGMVFKNLNTIYATSKSIAKQWDQQTIPLNTLREILDKSKLNVKDRSEHAKKLEVDFNKTLDTMYTICETKAKEMESNSVAVGYIKKCIDKTKDTLLL